MSMNLSHRNRESEAVSPVKKQQKVTPQKVKSERIKVFVRFKPLTEGQNDNRRKQIEYINDKELSIESHGNDKKIYCFDHVFSEHANNSEVFDRSCSQLIKGLYAGQSGLVFVYGNTGTGKTYTMGLLNRLAAESEGIVPDAFKQIFKAGADCTLSVSFCEIYMEEVYDLLSMEDKKLTIRETLQKQPYIENLLKIRVHSYDEASKLINIGLERRMVAEQKLNRNSSRSHALITLYLKNGNGVSRLCFVDLAGSERIKQTQSKGINLTQALHINSSLSALETLLINLSNRTLPTYRSNKLTRLLQPYFQLGRISLIVTHDSWNIQPIEFGKRCKGIKFIEKKPEEQRMRTSFTGISTTGRDLTPNKEEKDKLLYYVNCLVGLLSKIHKYIEDLVKKQEAPKPFKISQLVGPRDGKSQQFYKIQHILNSYLHELDERQKNIKTISVEVQEPEFIMTKIDNNKDFIAQIQNLGKSILVNTRFIHDVAESRKTLRQQIATAQFKCHLLEKKGKRGEEAIEYLVNKIDKNKIFEVCEKMKTMGIQVDVKAQGQARDSHPPKQSREKLRPRGGGQFIYIDEQHSNL